MKNTFQPTFWKKLRKLPIRPSAVGMASNFGQRSRRSEIFGYSSKLSWTVFVYFYIYFELKKLQMAGDG
jgi:hypothetical protein